MSTKGKQQRNEEGSTHAIGTDFHDHKDIVGIFETFFKADNVVVAHGLVKLDLGKELAPVLGGLELVLGDDLEGLLRAIRMLCSSIDASKAAFAQEDAAVKQAASVVAPVALDDERRLAVLLSELSGFARLELHVSGCCGCFGRGWRWRSAESRRGRRRHAGGRGGMPAMASGSISWRHALSLSDHSRHAFREDTEEGLGINERQHTGQEE